MEGIRMFEKKEVNRSLCIDKGIEGYHISTGNLNDRKHYYVSDWNEVQPIIDMILNDVKR